MMFEASCMELSKIEVDGFNPDDELPDSVEHNSGNTINITPYKNELFLGSISSHINLNLLKSMNVTHIITVHESLKPLYPTVRIFPEFSNFYEYFSLSNIYYWNVETLKKLI